MESTGMNRIWKMDITSTPIKSLLIDWWTKNTGHIGQPVFRFKLNCVLIQFVVAFSLNH